MLLSFCAAWVEGRKVERDCMAQGLVTVEGTLKATIKGTLEGIRIATRNKGTLKGPSCQPSREPPIVQDLGVLKPLRFGNMSSQALGP